MQLPAPLIGAPLFLLLSFLFFVICYLLFALVAYVAVRDVDGSGIRFVCVCIVCVGGWVRRWVDVSVCMCMCM